MHLTEGKALSHALRNDNETAESQDIVQKPKRHYFGPSELSCGASTAEKFYPPRLASSLLEHLEQPTRSQHVKLALNMNLTESATPLGGSASPCVHIYTSYTLLYGYAVRRDEHDCLRAALTNLLSKLEASVMH